MILLVGHSPGSQELLHLTATDSLQSSVIDLSSGAAHQMALYVTVRCRNNADLMNTLISDVIHIVMAAPDITSASISVMTSSGTHYDTRDSYQPFADQLSFQWHGFRDIIGIDLYEVGH